jgi:hypothetical protein
MPPRSPKPQPLTAIFETVRKAAMGLPEVEESTSYGTPALKVKGKLFVRLREDGELLVLRTDFDSRDAMLRAQPHIFCLTDHYVGYPAVLVRLSAVRHAQLRVLLADSWRFVAPKSLVARLQAGTPHASIKPGSLTAPRRKRPR